jgi:hypothetical protein
VRARVAGHIEGIFPDAKVFTDRQADYSVNGTLLLVFDGTEYFSSQAVHCECGTPTAR